MLFRGIDDAFESFAARRFQRCQRQEARGHVGHSRAPGEAWTGGREATPKGHAEEGGSSGAAEGPEQMILSYQTGVDGEKRKEVASNKHSDVLIMF